MKKMSFVLFFALAALGGIAAPVPSYQAATNIAKAVHVKMAPTVIGFGKVADYLYEADYADIDYGAISRFYETEYGGYGGCLSFRAHGFHARNYDWKYDHAAETVVRVLKTATRHGSIGIAHVGEKMTEEMASKGQVPDEVLRILPGRVVDGINDAGVAINVNVVHATGDEASKWTGTECPAMGAIRYVLDNCTNAFDAATWIEQKVYIPQKFVTEQGFSFHWMVSDEKETYIVEDGAKHLIVDYDATDPWREHWYFDPVMSNYRLYSSASSGAEFARNIVGAYDPYGSGIERSDLARARIGAVADVAGAMETLTNAWYSQAYIPHPAANPFWYTEFTYELGGVSMLAPNTALYTIAETQSQNYILDHNAATERGGRTWQTVHTAVYTLTNRTLTVAVQESMEKTHVFPLVGTAGGGAGGGADPEKVKEIIAKTYVGDYPEPENDSVLERVTNADVGLCVTNGVLMIIDKTNVVWSSSEIKAGDKRDLTNNVAVAESTFGDVTCTYSNEAYVTGSFVTNALAKLDGKVFVGNITNENGYTFPKLAEFGNLPVPSGEQWEKDSADFDSASYDIAYGNGRYVMLTYGKAYFSSDGDSWTASPQPLDSVSFLKFSEPDGVFYIGAYNPGDGYILMQSVDGSTWNLIEHPHNPARPTIQPECRDIVKYRDRYVLFTDTGVFWSPNLTGWALVSGGEEINCLDHIVEDDRIILFEMFNTGVYVSNEDCTSFTMVADGPGEMTCPVMFKGKYVALASGWPCWSDDLTTWEITPFDATLPFDWFERIVVDANTAVVSSPYIGTWWSSDIVTWHQATPVPLKVVFEGGKWVGCAAMNYDDPDAHHGFYVSENGREWRLTEDKPSPDNDILKFANNRYYALGYYYSADFDYLVSSNSMRKAIGIVQGIKVDGALQPVDGQNLVSLNIAAPIYSATNALAQAFTNDLEGVKQVVYSWEQFLDGSNVVFSITNYISGAYSTDHAKLQIKELRETEPGVTNYWTVYDSRTEITNHLGRFERDVINNPTNGVATQINTVSNYLEEVKADKAWGKYASDGAAAPSNTVVIRAPSTVFASGHEFERVNLGSGTIGVLVNKGAIGYTGEPGTFRFRDAISGEYFGYKKNTYTVGAGTDGITVTDVGADKMVSLTYHITMGGYPCIYYLPDLDDYDPDEWEQLNDQAGDPIPGASHVVVWEDPDPEPGTKVCHINCSSADKGFFCAEIKGGVAGESVFETNMCFDPKGGFVAVDELNPDIKYQVEPYVNGTTVMWRIKP